MGGVTVSPGTLTLTRLVINTASAADLSLVAAAPGLVTRLYRLVLVSAGTTIITFRDGATAISGPIPLAANTGITLAYDGEPWFQTSLNSALIINNSQSIQISGMAYTTTTPL